MFKTVENHPIKVGECYQTRDGRKVFVHYLDDSDRVIYGQMINNIDGGCWFEDGTASDISAPLGEDLMRPWPIESVAPKMEVTEEVAIEAVCTYRATFDYYAEAMKAALEAVVASITQEAIEKPGVAITKEIIDDGWIDWKGGECPVDGDTLMEVKFRVGITATLVASSWHWQHCGIFSDIIAYRFIPEPTEEKKGPVMAENDVRRIAHEIKESTFRAEAASYKLAEASNGFKAFGLGAFSPKEDMTASEIEAFKDWWESKALKAKEEKDCHHPDTIAFNFCDNEKSKTHYGKRCNICKHQWEEKKEPQKQTLLEYAMQSPLKLTYRENAIVAIISKYLEQNK